LVLGAYGLAGRAIVTGFLEKTELHVLAAGRNAEKLATLYGAGEGERLQIRLLDIADAAALRRACGEATLVVNAVGPYAKSGADVARAVVEAGRPYIDCANEQTHYHRLQSLDGAARERAIPLITAAGAIPGISTLLAADMIAKMPDAESVEWCWAQGRHAYAESGLASMMGGILEAMHGSQAYRDGRLQSLSLGSSRREIDLGPPLGSRTFLEAPTIDDRTVPARFSLRESRSWFYFGDLPLWMLRVVRFLQPHRRRWSYALVEAVMRRINDQETAKAIAEGVSAESMLQVTVRAGEASHSRQILFRDGAVATAMLPVYLAGRILRGEITATGLLTPLDIVDPAAFLALPGPAILRRSDP
jgi:saccharopine dehydrogenase-like NADP-dependent oxidoreductase